MAAGAQGRLARADNSPSPFRPASWSLYSLLAAALLLAIALLVRLPSFDGRPLWNDELWRALVVLDPHYLRNYFQSPNEELAITSPAYALLMKLTSAFYVSPTTLRLSSLLPGLFAPLAAFAIVRRAGGGIALAFICGQIFVLNEDFISYSGELKPYMFEVLVHLVCVYAWLDLAMASRPAPRAWAVLLLILAGAVLATPTVVFLLPAAGLSLLVKVRAAAKPAAGLIAGFGGIAILVGALYALVWRHGAGNGMLSYWAAGFRPPGGSYIHFLAAQLFATWQAAIRTIIELPLQESLLVAALAGALVWVIVARAALSASLRELLVFYLTFLASLGMANFLALWPLGVLRPNLFVYAHLAIFPFLVLARVPLSRQGAPLLLAVIVLFLLWHGRSSGQRELFYGGLAARLHQIGPPLEQSDRVIEDFSRDGPVGKSITAQCGDGSTVVIVDEFSDLAIQYFTRYDTAHRPGAALLTGPCVTIAKYGFAAGDPKGARAVMGKALAGKSHAWFLYTHTDDAELAVLKKIAGQFGGISQGGAFSAAGYFALAPKPAVSGR